MARPLLIAHRENATIEELKQVSRVGSSETATRCSAIQMLLAGADRQLVCNAVLVTNRALRKMYLPPYSPDLNPIERIWLKMKARWFNNYVCKNEEKLLERLDQPYWMSSTIRTRPDKPALSERYFDKRSRRTDNILVQINSGPLHLPGQNCLPTEWSNRKKRIYRICRETKFALRFGL